MASTAGVASGTVMMDDIAERAPLFAAFYVEPGRDKVMPIVSMEPVMVEKCDGVRNQTGCIDLVIFYRLNLIKNIIISMSQNEVNASNILFF